MSYYEKNKTIRLNYQKQYYQVNRDRIKKYTKRYYEENKDTLKTKRKQKKNSQMRKTRNRGELTTKMIKFVREITLNFD